MQKFFVLTLLILSLKLFPQQLVIKGRVNSAKNNTALPGALVLVDAVTGTSTDVEGHYLFNLSNGSHTIEFKMLGYKTNIKKIEISNQDTLVLNAQLEEELTSLNTVVVSAGRYEQKISDLTLSMEVIKPQLVENKNATTLESIIDQVPGVSVVDGQASIRGGSGFSYGAGSRVLTMVDDLPMLTADAGDVKWTFLPVENLEQVEVIKGASSALFGSSALNGVINMRTAFPKDTPLTKCATYFTVYSDPERAVLKWWGKDRPFFSGTNFMHSEKIKNLDLVVGGNAFYDLGYRQFETDERYRFNFNTRYRFEKINGLAVGLNGNIMTEDGGLFLLWANADSGGYRPTGGALQNFNNTRTSLDPYITYFAKNGDRHSLRTRYFNSTNTNGSSQGSISDLYYGEYQYQKHFQNELTIVTGIVGTYSEIKSPQLYGTHFGSNFSAYLQMDKKIKRFTFSVGARAEQYRVDSSRTTDTFLGINAKPVLRVGVNYHLAKVTFLRASYGQGYRFPSVAEKFVSTNVGGLKVFPNTSLLPETGWSAELGVKQGIKISEWNGYIDLAGFQTEYQNMMEFAFGYFIPSTIKNPNLGDYFNYAGFRSQNVGSTRINGIDVSVSGAGKLFGVSTTVMVGYTYTKPVTIDYDPAKDSTSSAQVNVLKYRYYHTFKGDVQFDYKGWSFGTSVRYTSFMINIDKKFEQPLFSEIVPTFPVYILPGLKEYREKHNKGTLIFDMRLSYQCTAVVKLALIVNNVFNVEYMDRPGNIRPPRTIGLQLSVKL